MVLVWTELYSLSVNAMGHPIWVETNYRSRAVSYRQVSEEHREGAEKGHCSTTEHSTRSILHPRYGSLLFGQEIFLGNSGPAVWTITPNLEPSAPLVVPFQLQTLMISIVGDEVKAFCRRLLVLSNSRPQKNEQVPPITNKTYNRRTSKTGF